METQLLEDMEKQFSLVKKLIALKTDKDELLEEAHKIEKIIKTDLPKALEMEAPPDLPALCFDLQEVYEQFEDFLVFQDMIGKKIVALGGGFSTGKSSFLNGILSENSENRVRLLPMDTAASTSVPTYLMHADGAETIRAINLFDSRITDLTADDVGIMTHSFEEKSQLGVSLGQLIQRMFISTPLQSYAHIAFLDTPGYSKPDTKDYSARTDEQIAREQLNHSDFILWFVNGAVLPQSDIEFLKQLDSHIPKAIILNKADRVLLHGMANYQEVIESIKKDATRNGITFRGVWGYTCFPQWQKEIASDIQAVHDLLQELDVPQKESHFGHDFMKLFVECEKYYRKELSEESARLQRVNKVMFLSDDKEIRSSLQDSQLILNNRINKLKQAQGNLENQKNIFFDMVRKVAQQVHISIPTPSELELAEENAGDPAVLLANMLQKSGKKENLVMVIKLKDAMNSMKDQKKALPGSSGYKNQLFQVLKEQLGKNKDEG